VNISTHVLDAVSGTPASGVPVILLNADYTVLDRASTDDDGRIAALGHELPPAVYRLQFDTAAYFTEQGLTAFYPEVTITFEISDTAAKYHVPLLLSPFAYSTYRGS
jgi:5-hydroxyisourate hydrolase